MSWECPKGPSYDWTDKQEVDRILWELERVIYHDGLNLKGFPAPSRHDGVSRVSVETRLLSEVHSALIMYRALMDEPLI